MSTTETRFHHATEAIRAQGITITLNSPHDEPTPDAPTPYLFHSAERGEADFQFSNGRAIHVHLEDCDCGDIEDDGACQDCLTGTDRPTSTPVDTLEFSYDIPGTATAEAAATVFEHYGFTVTRPTTEDDPLVVSMS